MFDFLNAPVSAAFHLLTPLIAALHPFLGGASTAAAVILICCTIRLLLHPLARAAYRGERARAALAPQITALRERHKNNPDRFRQEVTKLQQTSGTSMLSGCLPLLLQMPVLTIMSRLCTVTSISGHPNPLLAGAVFGIPYNQHPLTTLTSSAAFTPTGLLDLALLILLALTATLSLHWQPTPLVTNPHKPPTTPSHLTPRPTPTTTTHRPSNRKSPHPTNPTTATTTPKPTTTRKPTAKRATPSIAAKPTTPPVPANPAAPAVPTKTAAPANPTAAITPTPPGANALRYLAYYPVALAAFLPLAGAIYLLTTTTWTVLERKLLRKQPPAGQSRDRSVGC